MKKLHILLIIVLALFAFTSLASAAPGESKNFVAVLNGANEVPPRDTNAHGVAIFHLNEGETELSYKLIVANIDNTFAAHIHCGSPDVAGPVGVTLFMGTPAGGRFDGILAQGVITAPNPGNACGWETLDEVIAAMRSGDTYVNVHTNDAVDPPNTGPGDFPGGEIRGQVREAGPTQ